jgi:ATP-dependent protease ClpP protease subunit
LIKPNANYRPNPSRAIYLDGPIDDQLLSRLIPQILKLQGQSRAPITLYILNSPGGQVAAMKNILQTLKLANQDSAEPCQLITVVTTKAQSAAADLLSSGDYALALPSSSILYHGVRTAGIIPALQPLTAERTSLLAHILRLTNDAYAMELARKTESRFMFRFIILRHQFKKVRDANRNATLSDLDCFTELLSSRLSNPAKKVLKKAQERYKRYEPLFNKLIDKAKTTSGPERPANLEADRIKAIVDFEVESNKADPSWTFKDGGLTRLVEDFFLMAEYLESQNSERVRHWCLSLGRFALSQEELAELGKITDEKARDEKLIEKVQPPVLPLWMLFIALCHALQEDDNDLTAADAYWLGLVDEVWGDSSMITTRWFAEFEPDPPEKQDNAEETAASTIA